MRILAIETATIAVGAAVADENGLLAVFELRAGRRHAELLHGVVMSVLETAGVGVADLDGIAVDVGPGRFTGIRVGVSAAKGFAMALGLPVVALTSIDILVAACAAAGNRTAIGVVDLRRGEVAWRSFGEPPAPGGADRSGGAGGLRHGPPELLASELVERLAAAGRDRSLTDADVIVLAGDGAVRHAELLTAGHDGRVTIAGPELTAPPVSSLAVRGVTELAAGRVLDPLEIRPSYLRDADVRINWTTRHDVPGRFEAEA